jgi:hypothetical protein
MAVTTTNQNDVTQYRPRGTLHSGWRYARRRPRQVCHQGPRLAPDCAAHSGLRRSSSSSKRALMR